MTGERVTWQIELEPEQHLFLKQAAAEQGIGIGEYVSRLVEPGELSLEEERESLLSQLARLNDQVGKQRADAYTAQATTLLEQAGLLLDQARESDTVALAEAQARVESEKEGRRQELLGRLAALDSEYVSWAKRGLRVLVLQDVQLSDSENAFLANDSATGSDCSNINRRRYAMFPDRVCLSLASVRAQIAQTGRKLASL